MGGCEWMGLDDIVILFQITVWFNYLAVLHLSWDRTCEDKKKSIILKEGLALLEYVSTCYIKNILKKRENTAALPHFVVGLCGYAPRFMLCSAALLGFTRAPPHRHVRFPGLCMTWVWFEVQGECKGNRGLSDRYDRDKRRLAGDPKFSVLCNNILCNLRTQQGIQRGKDRDPVLEKPYIKETQWCAE